MRVATLKIFAPCFLAARAFANKIRTGGVDLKLWNEMMRHTFFCSANSSSERRENAERSSTSI